MEHIIGESEELNELVSNKVSDRLEEINDVISGKADASNVYTKQQVETIISNIFSMNTIEWNKSVKGPDGNTYNEEELYEALKQADKNRLLKFESMR